jgi:hypothetical protein
VTARIYRTGAAPSPRVALQIAPPSSLHLYVERVGAVGGLFVATVCRREDTGLPWWCVRRPLAWRRP